jgi:hypothetical protein
VSEEFVTKQINKLNVKKATGHDGISPKILKMAQQEIRNPITKLVNKSIDSSILTYPFNMRIWCDKSFVRPDLDVDPL